MLRDESLANVCCAKSKENTVLDNVRETRDILTKTSDCLERLKMFLKLSPEEASVLRTDSISDFYNDVADLKTVASENLAKVRAIMDIIGMEG